MDPKIVLCLAASLIGGVLLAMQTGMNTQLKLWTGHTLWAAVASFVVGLVLLLITCAGMRVPLPPLSGLAQAPWWSWLGGLMGALFVSMVIIVAPRLGAATMIACVVAGQLLGTLLIDHWGLMGLPVHEFSLAKLAGAGMLLGGVVLVKAG